MQVGITAFGSLMLGVGSIVGSMAWLFHNYMIARAGTLASVVAWIFATLAFLPVALTLAELSSMFPSAGGPYVYKYYAFKRWLPKSGELWGFLTGWLLVASLLAGYACMSNGLANLLASTIYGNTNNSPIWFGPVTIFTLFGVTTLINLMQVSHATRLNNVFTLMKFAMAIAFGALVMACPTSSLTHVLNPVNLSGESNFMVNICSVLTLAIGGLGGIELIACASSETHNASRTVPRTMLLTLLSAGLIYAGMSVAVGAASPYVLSPDKVMCFVPGTNTPATLPGITGYLAGTFWGRLATAAVVASIVGCAIGGLLALARLAYSMALTGLFPRQFGQLNAKTQVPSFALGFQFVCLCILGIGSHLMSRIGIFPDAYSFLGETFSFMYILLIVMYGVTLISLRYTDPHLPRPFRIGANGNGLAWLTAILTVMIFGYIALFCTQFIYQFAGTMILASGLPIYGYFRWRKAPQ